MIEDESRLFLLELAENWVLCVILMALALIS